MRATQQLGSSGVLRDWSSGAPSARIADFRWIIRAIDGDRRPLRAAAAQPAHLGHRPLQPALPVLHARAGLRLAAARERCSRFEEIGDARRRLHGEASTASGSPAASRCCAATCRARRRHSPRSRRSRDLALTTNGVLLSAQRRGAARAGLHRITVSLDTLRPRPLPRADPVDDLARCSPGSTPRPTPASRALKIDTVVMRGVNDDELVRCIDYGRRVNAEVRFIEYMDVGGATRWSPDGRRLARRDARGARPPLRRRHRRSRSTSSAPAERFLLPDGTPSASSSQRPRRSAHLRPRRLTADGIWLLCLYARAGTDLRRPLRAGASREELRQLIPRCGRCAPTAAPRNASAWTGRPR